jgi:hypothetical protein
MREQHALAFGLLVATKLQLQPPKTAGYGFHFILPDQIINEIRPGAARPALKNIAIVSGRLPLEATTYTPCLARLALLSDALIVSMISAIMRLHI